VWGEAQQNVLQEGSPHNILGLFTCQSAFRTGNGLR